MSVNSKDKPEDFFQEVPQEKMEPLFDEETIKSTVKGFVLAFISGRVKIQFPNKEQIEWLMQTMEKTGDAKFDKKTKVDVALYTEMKSQQELTELIAICCRPEKATSFEQKRAFDELFTRILTYRSSGRIVGEFVNYDIAERVEHLEQGVEKINNLLKQLVEIHATELGL